MLKQGDVAIMDIFIKQLLQCMVTGLSIINYICYLIVNHSFSVINQFELFTDILSMVTLKTSVI